MFIQYIYHNFYIEIDIENARIPRFKPWPRHYNFPKFLYFSSVLILFSLSIHFFFQFTFLFLIFQKKKCEASGVKYSEYFFEPSLNELAALLIGSINLTRNTCTQQPLAQGNDLRMQIFAFSPLFKKQ